MPSSRRPTGPTRRRPASRLAARLVPLLLALLLLGGAAAQVCRAELEHALPAPDTPPGVAAAQLLRAAVGLAEPALPRLRWVLEPPLPEGERGAEAVRFLAERELLPEGWRADGLDPGVWQAMLDRFLALYEAEPVAARATDARPEPRALAGDLERALARVAAAVRPIALVALAQGEGGRVAFLGLVHNWSAYPRLIVRRPSEDATLAHGGLRGVLDRLGSCAVPVRDWVTAPEATARRLFLTAEEARMYVVGSEPEGEWPLLVEEGSETDYFAFAHPDVSGLDAFAAVFTGPSLGPATLARMLPSVRTNLGPRGLLRLFEVPSRYAE